MSEIGVTVFEDNKHLRESLFFIINGTQGLKCVGAHPDCRDLLFILKKEAPQVVLMDIEMPGMSGIEAVKIIRKNFPDIQVLMQTVFHNDENILNALCSGASGYILKTTSPAEYVEAIKDVSKGGSPMTGSIARRVIELFQKNIHISSENNYQLTSKEKEVLQLMVTGKSFKMIADSMNIAYETVRTHMKNIYIKLHVNSNTEAVSKALKERIV